MILKLKILNFSNFISDIHFNIFIKKINPIKLNPVTYKDPKPQIFLSYKNTKKILNNLKNYLLY